MRESGEVEMSDEPQPEMISVDFEAMLIKKPDSTDVMVCLRYPDGSEDPEISVSVVFHDGLTEKNMNSIIGALQMIKDQIENPRRDDEPVN